MEQLIGDYRLHIPTHAFPLSTDSMVLADFVRLPKNATVLDLGAGCGTLGVLVCAKDPACHVTGIELDPDAHQAALLNIEANALQARMHSICADIRNVTDILLPGAFTCCISNPPYFSGGKTSAAALARHETACTPEDLFRAAAWTLQYGGDFFLVHKPEKLAQLCACAANAGLEPKRLRLVRHKQDSPVSLILLQCRKGGKPGLVWEELYLQNTDGFPSDQYRNIYHL